MNYIGSPQGVYIITLSGYASNIFLVFETNYQEYKSIPHLIDSFILIIFQCTVFSRK